MTTQLPPTDALVAQMRRNVLTDATRTPKRHKRVKIAAALVIAGLATTGSAIAVQMANTHDQNNYFLCYTEPDINGHHSEVGTVQPIDDEMSAQERVDRALDFCGASYRIAGPNDSPLEVHNPTACLLRDQRLAVFPNESALTEEQFCNDLGLHELSR